MAELAMVHNQDRVQRKEVIVVYMPVIHAGYLELFAKYPQAEIAVVDKELLSEEFRSLQKDIRALETKQIINLLQTLLPDRKMVHLASRSEIVSGLEEYQSLILPEDEISQWLEKEYLTKWDPEQIKSDSIFLRWSEAKVKQKQDVVPDEVVTAEKFQREVVAGENFQQKVMTSGKFQQEVMGDLVVEAKKSSDWWRQIAAAIFQNDELIAMAHNTHKPLDQNPYIFGDPRANSSRGLAIEVSTAMHAEQIVIAATAQEGVSLEGADLYVTTFPCPYCARLIAYSGIKRVFYKAGYSVLDGVEVMRRQGVKLVKVEAEM